MSRSPDVPPVSRVPGELKRDLRKWASLSSFDRPVLDAPLETAPVLPEWRAQALVNRGVSTMGISATEPHIATEPQDFWQLECTPQMRWRAVHVQSHEDESVTRRVLRARRLITKAERTFRD